MQIGLTDQEKKILEHLVAAWNLFLELGDKCPEDNKEFGRDIDGAELKIAYRVARRIDKDVWVQPENVV